MINLWLKKIFKKYSFRSEKSEIDPDEIFLDSSNLPQFNTDQFEGRLDKPITRGTFISLGIFFVVIFIIFFSRVWYLQIKNGENYFFKSENNSLRHTLIFAERGIISDRNNELLAWNVVNPENPDISLREYSLISGISNIVGYLKYPTKDKSGFYYQKEFDGKDGVEKYYNDLLSGENGLKITETDALGKITSESVIQNPGLGKNIRLSIDSRVQSKLYESMVETAKNVGFKGGAAVIMDVHNGEILAMTSFPQYDSQVVTDGSDVKQINSWFSSSYKPFLNRAISGLYTPGSIVKPFVALGALSEGIIDPEKKILSTGSISLPNPYFPDLKSVFMDWRSHGWVDMRQALAVSSNVYFYEIGGGFEDQKGLGISNIEKYTKMFGLDEKTGIDLPGEKSGNIPNPEWKKENFNGEDWRIGDTYHTAIGQYGFQVTPLEIVRAVASVANEGTLVTPHVLLDGGSYPTREVPIKKEHFKIVKEGMRLGVLEGTAKNLNIAGVEIASKTGTAELGVSKEEVNSWATGFFPYQNPKYAFAIVMEKGSRNNLVGSIFVLRTLFDWMSLNTPEYF